MRALLYVNGGGRIVSVADPGAVATLLNNGGRQATHEESRMYHHGIEFLPGCRQWKLLLSCVNKERSSALPIPLMRSDPEHGKSIIWQRFSPMLMRLKYSTDAHGRNRRTAEPPC